MDVAGIEPATPCLQSKQKINLSHCFGCAYSFQTALKLLQCCSEKVGHGERRQRAAYFSMACWRLAIRPQKNFALKTLGNPLHRQFLALPRAVEEIKVD